ncbi:aminopeptidase N [Corynebacterium sp. HMSC062E11]|uniref:aminopeptidase N n=1 Tax=unclassified Corynebacterium TaxID=2624378 RepID=UPI0008A5A2CA|nr:MULTISPECIES: aminopeptidase N [unclassified Corynebacterium]MDK6807850.1 aminopeptidase N [Corynebacterium aurimucosum]NJJ82727.1 aminopeptidase N [Corynebacterium aurimucosum]OFK26972.1 aminopeptidase N [Corynebacterium sp. HMSC062E11]OFK61004.1 aminopeptidase N [Corynebacterium sp. HMSC078A10]OFP70198.1 aminopeptidase N [Corynebacterium sp. HMSC078C09]
MTTANLTHAEATARSTALRLSTYDLHLDVTSAPTDADSYEVTSRITFTTTKPETFVDYLGKAVHAVRVNDKEVENTFDGGRVYLSNLPVGEELTVEITGSSYYSRTGQGLHRMHDQADDTTYLYSHLEPSDARRIFPCFDQPDLKASYEVHLTGPEGWQLLSNQPEISREKTDSGEVAHFAPTPLLSTYLTAFAAGPYVEKHSTWTAPDGSLEVELRAFARASMAEYLDDEILQVTAQGMDFFHSSFGYPYPWGKYDSIFVPEYNLGAMENPGLVTFTEHYLFRSAATRAQHAGRTNTILHEMSHMWFGDLVTPQWWDDLWLKESFAEFMGADSSVHATEYTEAWVNFAGQRKNWAYLQDQLPTTHPIKAEIPDVDAARQNFDGITYAKGAAVLKQLVHYVGRENFYAGARDYFQEHAFAAATFEDLLTALKKHTDRDLDAWSTAWLRTWGPDTLTPELHTDGDKIHELAIAVEAEDTTRPHRLNVALFDDSLNKYATLDVDLEGERTILDEASGLQAPALLLLNDGDHTYAKVRFDETSLETIRTRLSEVPDELSRAVIWTSLWNLTRDGEWPVRSYLDTVLNHAPAESNPTLLTTAFANARYAIDHFVSEDDREEIRADYAERLWEVLQQAPAGSDAQLTVARAAIQAFAANPAESGTPRLRALYDGSLDGLALDPDIRWAILRALAARDAVNSDELEAEKERDNTLTGAAAYLGASHAFPSAELKREVFDLVRTPGKYSNAEVDSLLAAFNAPCSAHLTEAFAQEYFDSLAKLWEEHPIEIANRLVRGLYPDLAMADAATSEFLSSERPRALRRVLLECQDALRRAQRVRAAQ